MVVGANQTPPGQGVCETGELALRPVERRAWERIREARQRRREKEAWQGPRQQPEKAPLNRALFWTAACRDGMPVWQPCTEAGAN
jgi:hypothetical protein